LRKACIISVVAVLTSGTLHAQATALPAAASPQQEFVNQYCAYCHNDKLKSGGMTLTKLDVTHPDQNAELAEKAIRKVRAGLMPPPGMPRPNAAAVKAFAASLESTLDSVAAREPNPGRPALHRLNRTEYANSIRDLLDVTVDVSSLLPADDMSHGFDNKADVLTISPALMEGYIRAAGKISREAVGDPQALALTDT
jgi:mono/diheme cytochrome c family protein